MLPHKAALSVGPLIPTQPCWVDAASLLSRGNEPPVTGQVSDRTRVRVSPKSALATATRPGAVDSPPPSLLPSPVLLLLFFISAWSTSHKTA